MSLLSMFLVGLAALQAGTQPQEVRFSPQFPPFPENHDTVRPGMRISEAKAALPNGSVSHGFYTVEIPSGPFASVTYQPSYGSETEDLVIGSLVFRFRDEESKRAVTAAALKEYGGIKHSTEAKGSKITWPDLRGHALSLADDGYLISGVSLLPDL